jgi:hypothetical protein
MTLLVGLLVIASSLALQSRLARPVQLVVERTEFSRAAGPSGARALAITLFNPGPKTIHAWSIRTMATFTDGRTDQSKRLGDTCEWSGEEGQESGPILPGGRRILQGGVAYPSGERGPVSVGAGVNAVIFDDDMAAGEEEDIDVLFDLRLKNHRAWPAIEQLVRAAVADGGEPRAILERLAGALIALRESGGTAVEMSSAFRWTHGTVRPNLPIAKDPARLLDMIVTGVRDRSRAAEAHHLRRF